MATDSTVPNPENVSLKSRVNRSRGGEDEAGTVRLLKSHTQALSELVGKFDGRVLDSAGDCLLAEFASVVDAVHCALEIQQGLQSRNGSSGCPRAEEYASPGPQSKEKFRQAVEMAEKVRTMDPSYYGPCMILALNQVREKRFEEALANARKC